MKTRHRILITEYVRDGKYIKQPHQSHAARQAKSIAQIALEIGVDRRSVRRWLKRDHREEWLQHWASAGHLLTASRLEKIANTPPEQRSSMLVVAEGERATFRDDLNRALEALQEDGTDDLRDNGPMFYSSVIRAQIF